MITTLVACHAFLLRTLGDALTVDPPAGPHDVAIILGGEHRLQVAAKLLEANQLERVLLIDGRPDYLVASGLLPSSAETAMAELSAAGIPSDRIELMSDESIVTLADIAQVVQTRLQQEPETRWLAICGALDGRLVRIVFNEVLHEQSAGQISILGLPYDEFDVQIWWRSRTGLKRVFGQLCAIGSTLALGVQHQKITTRVDPDSIEADLERRFGEKACYDF